MKFIYSKHWKMKRKFRKAITDSLIEYAIINSPIYKDKYWPDALNAICRVRGRVLKVVYKRISRNKIKIITAFWLD